ncbi:hypothetical protein MHU86_6341 [Fragilaria crotonensis]|nr:hypothetical protein MHU86_6341 [Fragilaria crotonensis]
MLFFWNRYELAAVAHGLVTLDHPRMGSEESSDHPFIPRLDTHHETPITLAPRAPRRENSILSEATADRSEGVSRSASGLFQHDTDEDDSCLYMLSGEVVYQRRARTSSPSSYSGDGSTPRRRATSTSEDQIPLEVQTTSPSLQLDLTPRTGSSSRNNEYRASRPGLSFPF